MDRHRRAAQPVALGAAGTVIAAADAVRASVIFLALAAVGLTTMVIVCALTGRTIYQVLMAWDANNYLAIAWHGYPHHLTYRPDGTPQYSLLAFFPLLPFLVRQVNSAGIPLPWAGVMVSVLAGAAAAAAVYTLVASLAGRRAGFACAGMWSASPYAFLLWIPYAEAVYSAAALWTLVALVNRRWAAAGALCAVADFARPSSAALVATVVITSAVALARRGDGARPLRAMLPAVLGLAGALLYIGAHIGRWDGWFVADSAWSGQGYDFGAHMVSFAVGVISGKRAGELSLAPPRSLPAVATVAVVVLAAVALIPLIRDRAVPWPAVLLLAAGWALTVGTIADPICKPRYLLPYLPLALVPLSRLTARVPWRALALGLCAILSACYGVYHLTGYSFPP